MIASRRDPDVAIVGLGVIGGSAALRLKERGTAVRGFSISSSDNQLAHEAGLTIASAIDEAVRDVGLVLIAVPVDHICRVATEVMGAAPSSATLLHAGSLQRMEALHELPEEMVRVIGTHPLAGSHRRGFGGARADLFRDATVFVEDRASARQKEEAELFWSLAGAKHIEYAGAGEHDAAMAWISHLPQLASTALAAALADIPGSVAVMPGPGARDATRLAMSSLEMWRPILERAPIETTEALRALEINVRRLRNALETREWATLQSTWERAEAWRASAEPRGGTRGDQ
jgi:prephenate dehydrogenase